MCLGSSCFVNGNSTLLSQVQSFLKDNNLTDSVELKGSLCQSHCKEGPSITVDGTLYVHLSELTLDTILRRHLLNSLEPSHE